MRISFKCSTWEVFLLLFSSSGHENNFAENLERELKRNAYESLKVIMDIPCG